MCTPEWSSASEWCACRWCVECIICVSRTRSRRRALRQSPAALATVHAHTQSVSPALRRRCGTRATHLLRGNVLVCTPAHTCVHTQTHTEAAQPRYASTNSDANRASTGPTSSAAVSCAVRLRAKMCLPRHLTYTHTYTNIYISRERAHTVLSSLHTPHHT
jgi:hypothetical protein